MNCGRTIGMANNTDSAQSIIEKLRGVTAARVGRSLRARMVHRLGRFDLVRAISAAGTRQGSDSIRSALFPELRITRVMETLNRDGLVLDLKLPARFVDDLRAYADKSPRYGNWNHAWGYREGEREKAEAAAGSPFVLSGFYNNIRDCPAIKELAEDPFLFEVARRWVGPRTKVISTHLWWSHPYDRISDAERNHYAQKFHYDIDDFKFLKVFFYLTDVDEDSGPHIYVKGTHVGKRLKIMFPFRRLEDDEVLAEWGTSRIVSIQGPAGSGFIEDTFGIHKGQPPRTKERLCFQILYGQFDYGFNTERVPDEKLARIPL